MQLLQIMGGRYSDNLGRSCTHLICPKISGAKCQKAIELGVPMVTLEWVFVRCCPAPSTQAAHAVAARSQSRRRVRFACGALRGVSQFGAGVLLCEFDCGFVFVNQRAIDNPMRALIAHAE